MHLHIAGRLRRTSALWRRLRRRVGWLDHFARAAIRYDEADGGRLAAAVTGRVLTDLLVLIGLGLLLAASLAVAYGTTATARWLVTATDVRRSLRRILGPALLVATGLELLKTLGRLYVERTEANPSYQLVAGSVGLLVFLNAINQLVPFAAALTATNTAGRPTDLAAAAGDESPTA
ncbi:hypothetical protein [Cryptosporangium arvum]|uniref:hypothetical protein n=1 Tax=Cryptosporangium arvum TaxID=80871 RepID=UPI0004BCA295|nr:hypothetical protein [Cryptosporangium arvum]